MIYAGTFNISKLPMRQLTPGRMHRYFPWLSKLPMRQLTSYGVVLNAYFFSKLPMRQLTVCECPECKASVSKLPMRQLTDAGAEKEADSTCAYTSFSHFDPNLFLL